MRTIELDGAAAAARSILDLLPVHEYEVGPFTWRDANDAWRTPLHHDRSQISQPASLGFLLHRGDAWGSLVLFAQGWADVQFGDAKTGREHVDVVGWDEGIDLEGYKDLVTEFVALFDDEENKRITP